MTDEELDQWMAEVDEQILAALAERVDVEARLREVLEKVGYDPDAVQRPAAS